MRSIFSKFAFTVALMLALTFTFGCSPGGGGNSGSSGDSSGGTSSPSNGGGNNRCTDIANCKTKPIGSQVWLAENLNIEVSGSRCYNDDPANCAKYGRLYDWATAMALDTNCNSTTCASQIDAKHKGICPSGWHIPSDDDWNVLMKLVNPNPSCSDNRHCDGGTKLKAREGWNSYSGVSPGTDEYGFSALPGGTGSSGGHFVYVGDIGWWWKFHEKIVT